ncbi:hypothetical protein C8T65DRAFT_658729, partial [Cerioporus squamosus]
KPRPQAQRTQPQRRQHRVYEPGKRHMELIASVSRSSGLEKDGDALRDPKIQEEYRAFIQGKVDEYWKKYPLRSHRASGHEDGDAGAEADARRNRMEMEENLLILFRKLREGLLSIHRRDAFALEVYETSLHLSVLFKSPVQTTSTLSHLFPDLYVNIHPSPSPPPPTSSPNPAPPAGTRAPTLSSQTPDPRRPATQSESSAPQPPRPPAAGSLPDSERTPVPRSALSSTLILLLHHLAQSKPTRCRILYTFTTPSQASLPSVDSGLDPPLTLGDPASAREWVRELARCLRARNYARLDALTRREAYEAFVIVSSQSQSDHLQQPGAHGDGDAAGTSTSTSTAPDGRHTEILKLTGGTGTGLGCLALEALGTLVETLLDKARGTTWAVLRSAYREVSLRAVVPGTGTGTTGDWLVRSLVLRGDGGDPRARAERWLDERRARGEARRKEGEGMEGRWVLVKA